LPQRAAYSKEEEEMGNEVSVFGGKVDIADMKSLAQRAQVSASNTARGGAPGGSDYMNFSGKRGVYTIGQEKRRIENDERWVVDITSFEEGWVCWKGGQSPSSRMANIYNGVPIPQPDPDELGPFDTQKGDGWFAGKAMVLKSCDEDQQGYFKINSVSGVSSMSELMEEFAERANAGLPAWPVVCLDMEEFESQGFKNFKPIFDVQGWLSNEQLQELADGADINDLLEAADDSTEPDGMNPPTKEDKPKAAAKPAGRRRARA